VLYIVGTNFYILLEHISIYCWSSYLCTSRAHFYALLEHFDIHCWNISIHFYIILYIVGTQFYTLLYALFGFGWSRFRYNNPPEERVFWVLCTVGPLIIRPQSENDGLGGVVTILDKIIPHRQCFIGCFTLFGAC
jgi:hypothetical protein